MHFYVQIIYVCIGTQSVSAFVMLCVELATFVFITQSKVD